MNNKKRFTTLKSQIMISVLIPVVVCFVITGTVLFLSLFHSLNAAAEAEFLHISQKYADSFEKKINNSMNYLSFLTSELEMQVEIGAANRETLQRTIYKLFDEYELIDGSSVYFEPNMFDGKDADYIGTEYGTVKSGRICWYFYTDNGKTAYLPEALGNDIEFDEFLYTEAKETNKPIYTNPTVFEVDGNSIPMFTLTYPINDSDGNFIGAITVDLFLYDIYTQFQAEKIYETGYILIANDKGQVVYSPYYEDIGKSREETGLDYPLDTATFFNAKSVINGKDTLVTIDSIYIPRLDSSFYISVAAPLEEIKANGTQLTIILVVFCVFVIFTIALILYFLMGRLWAPLNEITESVNKIAGGDRGARIQGSYTGEFAVVRDSVNTMADSIETYIKESDNVLDTLKNILNGMDAYLYVSDPETDELLFLNDKMKNLFHIKDNGTGQICWKVFQDSFDARCEFCPCNQLDLDSDKPVVWEEHNTITRRYYRNTDQYINWIGGRKVHLQHSVDITDMKEATMALDRRLEQQAIMAAISQSFLSNMDIDTLMTNTLRMIGEFMGVAQILYYNLADDGVTMTCRNEWLNPALMLKTRIGETMELKGAMYTIISSLKHDQEYCLSSNAPEIKAAMGPYRVHFKEYITTPIFLNDKVCSLLDFSRDDNGREWSESDINLAAFITSLLSGVFDRHSMEGQLRRLSSIVESSPQYIACVTAEGIMNYANPALMDIYGLTETELPAAGIDSIFDEQISKEIKEVHIPKTIREGTDSFELYLTGRHGNKHNFAFSAFTIRATDNIGCIVTDITEIRTLEAELITAKEQAEQASRSKSDFLSRMSHEIRTPLNAVIGMNNIAMSANDPEKIYNCLEKIDKASKHLLGVINDILDMSKIEADKFELSYSEFDFERMLMNIMNVIIFRADEKRQNLVVYQGADVPPFIVSDEQRLSQVITNLLSNAVKFTPDHGTIILNTQKAEDKGEEVVLKIEVKDNGIGISEEQQMRLFTSFEQADGSISRKFGGTGLGLAISRRIVELMGGSIWVESEPGKGSNFIFTLKAKKGQEKTHTKLSPKIDKDNIRILAVDDSGETRICFTNIMEAHGLPYDVAAGGAEALDMIRQCGDKPYNVFFIDWHMPEMDGIALTKKIKEITGDNSVVFMVSVADWNEIEPEALSVGVKRFVSKPIFPSSVIDAVNECLGAESAKAEARNRGSRNNQDYSNYTILLAEDVEINQEIIIAVLESTGVTIDIANNGREAIEMFEADPDRYSLILMDIHMPEVDGYEATRRIRGLEVEQAKEIPILAMTANVFREDIENCLEAGMNDHIGKPVDQDDLFAKLGQYMG